MIRMDDLKVGDFVAGASYNGHCKRGWMGEEVEPEYNGRPYQVVSIALPFVLLTDGTDKHSIDTRVWGLVRVTRRYFDQYYNKEAQTKHTKARIEKRRRIAKKNACPKCGGDFKRKMIAGQGIWFRECSDCGYREDPPKQGAPSL